MELGLQITLIGMGVVFATLVVLMGVVKIPLLVQKVARGKSQEPKPQPVAVTPSHDIPPQHVAVIAAAVAMLGQAYRVKTIEFIGNDNWERSRYTEITSL